MSARVTHKSYISTVPFFSWSQRSPFHGWSRLRICTNLFVENIAPMDSIAIFKIHLYSPEEINFLITSMKKAAISFPLLPCSAWHAINFTTNFGIPRTPRLFLSYIYLRRWSFLVPVESKQHGSKLRLNWQPLCRQSPAFDGTKTCIQFSRCGDKSSTTLVDYQLHISAPKVRKHKTSENPVIRNFGEVWDSGQDSREIFNVQN